MSRRQRAAFALLHFENQHPIAGPVGMDAGGRKGLRGGVEEGRPGDRLVGSGGRVIPTGGDSAGKPGQINGDRPCCRDVGESALVVRSGGGGDVIVQADAGVGGAA